MYFTSILSLQKLTKEGDTVFRALRQSKQDLRADTFLKMILVSTSFDRTRQRYFNFNRLK
jgi:hypothetical protein